MDGSGISASGKGGRLYYGWLMLPVATLGFIVTSPAQTYGVSLFNASFRAALDISHSQLSGAYMLGTFLGALPMGYVGALMDRYGLRFTTTVTVVLLGLTCMVMSQVTGFFSLFMGFFMLRMLGPGALAMLTGTVLSFWFSRRLGLVEGVRHVGIAGGMALAPTLMLWLIRSTGWRWTYAIMGLSVLVIMLPLMAFVFKNRPEDLGQRMDGAGAGEEPAPDPHASRRGGRDFTFWQALSARAFWISAVAIGMWAMINTAVQFNIVPLLESRGMGEQEAAMMFRIYALTLALMYLPGGYLADRMPLNWLLSVAMAGLVIAVVVLLVLNTRGGVYLFGITLGATQAVVVPVLVTMLPRYYGLTHLGKIRGVVSTLLVASSSLGPFLIGFCYDMFGGYREVLLLLLILPVPMIVLSLLATPPLHPESGRC